MGYHVFDDVGIAHNREAEAPVSVDSRLPKVRRFVIFFGVERGGATGYLSGIATAFQRPAGR
jgi:hypothetical protein